MNNEKNNDDNFLEPEPIDPKKLFNEEEYSTLIVNREGFDKKQNQTADLIESLFEKKLTRLEQEAIFDALKIANAQKMIVDTIQSTNNTYEQTILCQAAWECGLDFSNYFLVFVTLACKEDDMLCIEAFTVIDSTETIISTEIITQAIAIVTNAKKVNPIIQNDLLEHLNSRLSE
ncbi:MAG: hypothetical protein LCH32_01405 [Bacteroidetes bacterium]|nr:hypothetical protein [Bacteroidota bacterium]